MNNVNTDTIAIRSPGKRNWPLKLSLILLVALLFRAGDLFRNVPMVPGGDEGEYMALAVHFVEHGDFRTTSVMPHLFQGGAPGDLTAYRSPALPLFLAAHYRVFGYSQVYPRISLILLSVATCALLFLLGRELSSERVGLMAALLWAVWPPALLSYYAADRFYPESLGLFFLAAHLVSFVSIARNPSGNAGRYCLSGLLLGLAVLVRGYLLLLVPLEILYIVVTATNKRSALKMAGVSLIGVSLLIGPWVLRNRVAVGSLALSTQTEAFYLGNNAWARGSFNGDMFKLGKNSPQLQALEARYPNIWRMSENERSKVWTREGLRCVRENPARFAWLLMRKTLIFWGPFQDWSAGSYRWHYAFLLALPLAVLGTFVEMRKGNRVIIALLLPVAAVFLACLMTYAHDRYRYTIEPLIVLLAARGIDVVQHRLARSAGGPATP